MFLMKLSLIFSFFEVIFAIRTRLTALGFIRINFQILTSADAKYELAVKFNKFYKIIDFFVAK